MVSQLGLLQATSCYTACMLSLSGLQVQWISLRSEGGTVGGPEAALLAYARALVVWHDSMPGAAELYVPPPPTKPAQGGHAR